MRLFFILFSLVLFQLQVFADELTYEERKLKERILEAAPDNYLENAYYSGGTIIRWNKAYMPLKVYVENNPNVPYYYDKAFIRAVAIWNKELKDIVQVVFVDKDNDADISFKVLRGEEYLRELKNQDSRTLAYTSPEIKNNKLLKMNIYVYEKDLNGKFLEPYRVLNAAVHEFGHAMGIHGHPNMQKSIMYALFDPRDRRVENFISKEDKATLTLLYMIEPDITNGDKTKETGNIKSEILLGTIEERINNSIKNLEEELKIMPKDCYIKVKLAYLYSDKKDEKKFLEYMDSALLSAKTNEEFFTVYMAYATYYYEKRDKENALRSVNYALKYKKDKSASEIKKYIEALK